MQIARDSVFWINFAFYFTTLHAAMYNMNRWPGGFRHHLVKGIFDRKKGGREGEAGGKREGGREERD